MLSPLILGAAAVFAAPSAPLPVAMPEWLPALVAVVDREMATVESGRRLQAAAGDVELEARELPAVGPPILYEPGARPVFAIDPRRARELTRLEFELALARERARAARDVGVRLIELEQSAEQAVLEYTLDRYRASAEFRELVDKVLPRARARARIASSDARLSGGASRLHELPLPPRDPERQVELVAMFAAEPQEFYWAVERELLRAPDAVRLSDLETFLWAYAERLEGVSCPPAGRYCAIEGRLVRPAIVKAARAALAGGGLDRVREALGPFQGEAAGRLRERARAWLGEPK
ncbi:MAG: hypothetical protein HY553_14465 [Elusimicrobia bacterium]|nr:hypothetical protein [Elusimicrobiota bacterium]